MKWHERKKEEVIDKFQRSKQEEPVKGTGVYLCVDETTFELVKQLNGNGTPHLAVAALIRGNKYGGKDSHAHSTRRAEGHHTVRTSQLIDVYVQNTRKKLVWIYVILTVFS